MNQKAAGVWLYTVFLLLCNFSCSDTSTTMRHRHFIDMDDRTACASGRVHGLVMMLRGGKKQSSKIRNSLSQVGTIAVSEDVRRAIRELFSNVVEGSKDVKGGSQSMDAAAPQPLKTQEIVNCREELERLQANVAEAEAAVKKAKLEKLRLPCGSTKAKWKEAVAAANRARRAAEGRANQLRILLEEDEAGVVHPELWSKGGVEGRFKKGGGGYGGQWVGVDEETEDRAAMGKKKNRRREKAKEKAKEKEKEQEQELVEGDNEERSLKKRKKNMDMDSSRDTERSGSSQSVHEESSSAKKKRKKKRRKSQDGSQNDPTATPDKSLRVQWSLPRPRPPLNPKDVRDYILYSMGCGASPSWASVEGSLPVGNMIIICVDSLGHDTYLTNQKSLPFLSSRCQDSVILRAPGTPIEIFPAAADIFTCPDQDKGQAHKKKEPSKASVDYSLKPSDCLLSFAELVDNRYPISPNWQGGAEYEHADGYVETRPEGAGEEKTASGGQAKSERMIAMDCEMCTTKVGLELTRISLVDEDCKTVYDSFVKPFNAIVDYNTKYSGITEDMLKDVDTTLYDVQQRILALCSSETILVGHSLENDLRACRIYHNRVIDTAVLFPHPKGNSYKHALRHLVSRYLRREMDRKNGHCSVDDAAACMQLVKLKLMRGPFFGVSGDCRLKGENLFHRLERKRNGNVHMFMLGDIRTIGLMSKGSSSKQICCKDEQSIVEEAEKIFEQEPNNLLLVSWLDIRPPPEDRVARRNSPPAAAQDSPDKKVDDLESRLLGVDQTISRLCSKAPSGTSVVILGPSEDLSEIEELRLRRRTKTHQKSAGMPWSEEDEKMLNAKINEAKNGCAFFFFTER